MEDAASAMDTARVRSSSRTRLCRSGSFFFGEHLSSSVECCPEQVHVRRAVGFLLLFLLCSNFCCFFCMCCSVLKSELYMFQLVLCGKFISHHLNNESLTTTIGQFQERTHGFFTNSFCYKLFRHELLNNIAGEAWDPTEYRWADWRIKSDVIPSESDLYLVRVMV